MAQVNAGDRVMAWADGVGRSGSAVTVVGRQVLVRLDGIVVTSDTQDRWFDASQIERAS